MENQVSKPDNNMVWAILCTLFCCLPFGIVAIINAAKVDDLFRSGDYEGAVDASSKAKKYSLYGALVGGAFIFIYILFVVFAAVAGALS